MKLVNVRVTNYRSVEDSGDIPVDQLICLVGKNEAGKTAILLALAGLNPHPSTPITYDKETDYPRRYLTEYEERHGENEAIVVTTKWKIESEERTAIVEELGDEGLSSDIVTITRSYGDTEPQWDVPINYQKACEFLVEAERLTQQERKALGTFQTSDQLRKALESLERTPRQQSLLDRLNGFPGKNIRGVTEAKLKAGLP